MTPKISVIMPVYNTDEDYLRTAIESILKQSYKNFEFLIIDDCSKSYIKDIIQSYNDIRIKYFRLSKNSGAAIARNYAIKKAKGSYIAFLDSDDIALPNRFSRQIEYLQKHPQIGCLGTFVDIFGNSNKKLNFPKLIEHKEIEACMLFLQCAFCQSSIMLRKSILDKYNISYNKDFVPAEDYKLWLDLIGKTHFAILDEVLVKYRFHNKNISNQQAMKQKDKCLLAQLDAVAVYFNFTEKQKVLWKHFLISKSLSVKEIDELYILVTKLIKVLKVNGYSENNIESLLKKRIKKLYYHERQLKNQWHLFKSPIAQLFNLSLKFRFFCLITRGIL